MYQPIGQKPGKSLSIKLHIDFPLLLGLFTLGCMSLVVVYSAGGSDVDLAIRQGIRLAMAWGVMLLVAQIKPTTFRYWTPWIYLIGVLLLLAVHFLGDIGKGAQRWLDLGFIRIQPSEILKLAMPMMVAWYLSERPLPPSLASLAVTLITIAIPVGLIAKQPDLGTAILIAAAGVAALFLAGLSWKLIMGGALVTGSAMPIAWYYLHDYQRQRVHTFLNPEMDPLGAGYHIIQSTIAIGSGGLYGKGWLNGTQSQLDFIPEQSTDFIFAVFGEEFGFAGLALLLFTYFFIIIRGLYIALQAQDTYSRILAGSLSLTFFVYVFVNTGMVTGLLPVVGVPLPLISYGGTSMITLMAAFGFMMSAHTHRKLLPI